MLKPCDFKAKDTMLQRLEGLSDELRTIVNACPFTHRQIAGRIGCKSATTLTRLLNGGTRRTSVETLAWMAYACGYELRWEFVSRHVKEPAHGMEDGI